MTAQSFIKRSDLLHDISSLAYVIADVSEGKDSPHALHQTYDICQEGNIERVDSLLTLAAAEIGYALSPAGSLSVKGDTYVLRLRHKSRPIMFRITELAREYMVASVLYGWLSVTLPAAADFWLHRKEDILASLRSTAAMPLAAFSRNTPPI